MYCVWEMRGFVWCSASEMDGLVNLCAISKLVKSVARSEFPAQMMGRPEFAKVSNSERESR